MTGRETRLAPEVGKKGRHKQVLVPCSTCGKDRWLQLSGPSKNSTRCRSCSNTQTKNGIPTGLEKELSPTWKGGAYIDSKGYRQIRLYPDDPYFSLSNKNCYALEHRVIMAQHLGRLLTAEEIVHHRNGVKNDNRIKNLELMPDGVHHLPSMRLQRQVKELQNRTQQLEQRIVILEAENIILQTRIYAEKEI